MKHEVRNMIIVHLSFAKAHLRRLLDRLNACDDENARNLGHYIDEAIYQIGEATVEFGFADVKEI